MELQVRAFHRDDLDAAIQIWNRVVEDGVAFPQLEYLDRETGLDFFSEQSDRKSVV